MSLFKIVSRSTFSFFSLFSFTLPTQEMFASPFPGWHFQTKSDCPIQADILFKNDGSEEVLAIVDYKLSSQKKLVVNLIASEFQPKPDFKIYEHTLTGGFFFKFAIETSIKSRLPQVYIVAQSHLSDTLVECEVQN